MPRYTVFTFNIRIQGRRGSDETIVGTAFRPCSKRYKERTAAAVQLFVATFHHDFFASPRLRVSKPFALSISAMRAVLYLYEFI